MMMMCSSQLGVVRHSKLMSGDLHRQDVWDEVRDELHYREALLLLPAEVTWQH